MKINLHCCDVALPYTTVPTPATNFTFTLWDTYFFRKWQLRIEGRNQSMGGLLSTKGEVVSFGSFPNLFSNLVELKKQSRDWKWKRQGARTWIYPIYLVCLIGNIWKYYPELRNVTLFHQQRELHPRGGELRSNRLWVLFFRCLFTPTNVKQC